MIYEGEISCPVCSGELKYYDHVHRIMKGKEGTKQIIEVRRMQCKKCHKIHRELPDEILPYLHYERDIVVGVYNGWITPETLGYLSCYSRVRTGEIWTKEMGKATAQVLVNSAKQWKEI